MSQLRQRVLNNTVLYLIYCGGHLVSGFVHRSAYYYSLRLTACPFYCVLVLHLLGSIRMGGTISNLIFPSVFLLKCFAAKVEFNAHLKHICSTSLWFNRCPCPEKKPPEVLRCKKFLALLKKCLNWPLPSRAGQSRCAPPTQWDTPIICPQQSLH